MVFNIYLNSSTVFNIYFNSPTDVFEFFVNISHERKYEVIGYFFKFRLIVEFLVVYNGPVIITFHLSCTCIQNYNLFKYLNPHLVLSIFLKNSVMIKTRCIYITFQYIFLYTVMRELTLHSYDFMWFYLGTTLPEYVYCKLMSTWMEWILNNEKWYEIQQSIKWHMT